MVVGMEISILLSLSAFIGFLFFSAIRGVSILGVRRYKSTTNGSTARDRPVLEKSVSKCVRPARIFIPNMLARWPWPRQMNSYYATVKMEADAWFASFQAFSPKAQDAYDRCNFSLLACLAHPTASKEHVRAGCDLMHLFFVIDEYSDRSTPTEVRNQKDVVMDALRNPHTPRPKGEWVCGEMTRQFWERTVPNATATTQKRFIQSMDEYLESVVQEWTDKKEHRVLDIKTFIDARRRTSAVKSAFAIIELGLDIPDHIMSHPVLQEMVIAASDIIGLSNDMLSYNVEQRRGDDLYNILTCVMNEHHTDVNGAILWVEDYLCGAEERFCAAMGSLPKWEEPLDSQVKAYCNGLGQWVRANNDWSFESERYFGNKGPEIKEKRWMSLLPKKNATEVGPMHIDGSLL